MSIDTIQDPLVEFAIRVISHKFYQSSQLNSVPCIAIDSGYKIVIKDHSYDLAELQLQQLILNLTTIRKNKNSSCKFGSLLVCIFFFLHNTFPTFGKITWKTNKSVTEKINEFVSQLGDKFNSVMTSHFEDFKKSMKGRSQIPISLVEKHHKDVCFLVDTDFIHMQVIMLGIRWLRPFPYEVNVDETSTAITTILAKDKDPKGTYFGTFEEEKAR